MARPRIRRTISEATVEAAAQIVRVHLHNPSKALAFQVAVEAARLNGENIVPTLWSDNYVELMPGESVTLTGMLPAHPPEKYDVNVSAWNAPAVTLHPAAATHRVAAVAP